MKKQYLLGFLISCSILSYAQTQAIPTAGEASKSGEEEFDKRWRFGLRVTPQTCWFGNTDKSITPNGTYMGLGFGLHLEYRFSETVGLVTGIGGDFEGGKYTSKFDTSANYTVRYWLDNEGTLIQPSGNVSNMRKQGHTEHVLNERTIKTTYITIPAILKMSTNELNGFKYFGMFGGEIGFRVKTKAKDTYYESYKFDAAGVASNAGVSELEDIDLSEDTPIIPMRVGLNLGIGTEYRLSGKTSFMVSANFFHSFINVLKSESESLISNENPVSDYSFVKQAFLMNAVRLNLGILF